MILKTIIFFFFGLSWFLWFMNSDNVQQGWLVSASCCLHPQLGRLECWGLELCELQSLTFLVTDIGVGSRPGCSCLQKNPHVASSLGLRFLVTWWLGSKRDRDREKEPGRFVFFPLPNLRSHRASLLFYSSV